MDNVLVLGYGEIGKAIEQICLESKLNVFWKDLNKSNLPDTDIDILHVCIPYTDYNKFKNDIYEVALEYEPELIIINSTVKIGTTERLIKDFYKKNIPAEIVFSPCRGVHPDLYKGLKTFIKYIGGSQIAVELAASHFDDIKIETKFMNLRSLEAAKLHSTTNYGKSIKIAKDINDHCKTNNLNFEDVYTEWNKTYNNGFKTLGKPEFCRPILYPPDNGLGGHCILENAEILYESGFESAKNVLKLGKDTKDKTDKMWQYCELFKREDEVIKIANECKKDECVSFYFNENGLTIEKVKKVGKETIKELKL